MKKNQNKYANLAVTGAFVLGLAVLPFAAFAQTGTATTTPGTSTHKVTLGGEGAHEGKKPTGAMTSAKSVSGTVTAVSGATITLTNKAGKVFTVDATNAKFSAQMGVTESISNVLVGDMVSARGTVNGTSVTATSISDASYISRTVFSGKVTAISGSMLTISAMKGKTYTVDATTATITKGFKVKAAMTLADVKVGDKITAIGTLSGTTVTATAVQYNGAPSARMMKPMLKTGLKNGTNEKTN